ncbi:transducin/WD40 repeat-like superfamily protein [Striga asiatica]|uniref:Transducin/WD40 repeat-like superfamily protein n=1 Tax=Striga asiatica TaxID=4170 RepID=A0A5A7NXH7_STRAF|nr:transducin/WD40 repeat-like superfamily protein [Striga asiatica]
MGLSIVLNIEYRDHLVRCCCQQVSIFGLKSHLCTSSLLRHAIETVLKTEEISLLRMEIEGHHVGRMPCVSMQTIAWLHFKVYIEQAPFTLIRIYGKLQKTSQTKIGTIVHIEDHAILAVNRDNNPNISDIRTSKVYNEHLPNPSKYGFKSTEQNSFKMKDCLKNDAIPPAPSAPYIITLLEILLACCMLLAVAIPSPGFLVPELVQEPAAAVMPIGTGFVSADWVSVLVNPNLASIGQFPK